MAEKDKKSSASFVPFRPLDSLFEPTIQEQPSPAKNGLSDLPVDDLYSFKDHPFRQYTEEKMDEMVESVREHGVITPILVRPRKDCDGYEIISGHNRVEACRRAGIETIPATIRDLDDDTAIILMVDSNLKQREKLLPTEKAKAYKMKLEALKRQAGRPSKNSSQVGITAPSSAAGKTFTLSAAGKDTRSLENITAYIPSNSSLQKIFLCATTAQVVATASIGVNTPALGALKIKKVGDDSTPLAGVKFGIYKDAKRKTITKAKI